MTWTPRALLIALLVGVTACHDPAKLPTGREVYQAYDRPASLPRDPSAVEVKVSTSQQRVYVTEGDRLLMVMPVSVGRPDTPTPHGRFRITRKDAERRASLDGYAWSGDEVKRTYRAKKPAGWSFQGTPTPYWCEFQPGVGFHTGWIKHTPSTTDGCIRMHRNLAPKFYQLVRVGTPVTIAEWQPEDAEHGSIPLPPDAGPLPDHELSYYLTDQPFTDHLPVTFE